MMEILKLISSLKENDIGLDLVGEDIEVYFNGEELPLEIANEIRKHKPDIVSFLKQQEQAKELDIPALPEMSSYLLSSSQRRLWILSQFEEGSVAYNIPGVYIFKGELNLDCLREAFSALIDRHEILRTTFEMNSQGDVHQFIHKQSEIGFSVSSSDLTLIPDRWSKVAEIIHKEIATPFDLSKGPLVRASVIQVEPDQWVFTYGIHHIISDGWSMGILIRELLFFYNLRLQKIAVTLPSLRIQYKEFAAWQQSQLLGGTLNSHRSYWIQKFTGELPVINFPLDKSRPSIRTYQGASVSNRTSKEMCNRLSKLCHVHGASLFMGLMSLVKILLYKYTGQEDLIVGSPIAGRTHKDLEDQIGFYLNMIAFRTSLQRGDSFTTLLQKVKVVAMGAYEHQVYPFDELVGSLNLQRDMNKNPLFDIMVVLQNTGKEKTLATTVAEGLEIRTFGENTNDISKFDLTFDFVETSDGLQMSVEYNTDIFVRKSVERMLQYFQQLMDIVITDPSVCLSELPLSSAIERDEILEGFNAPLLADVKGSVVDCFTSQVKAIPSSIALVNKEVSLSYSELDQLSTQVAVYLIQTYQIKVGDLVAIKLDRSEWLVIIILGILKSGAAYVPIDPLYPQDRIDYILTDSGCKVVIDDAELGRILSRRDNLSSSDLQVAPCSEDLAYVIYTSGSTGRPKGVMVEHGNVIAFCENFAKHFHLHRGMSMGAATNYTFDISVLELVGSLCCGLKVVLLPGDDPLMILSQLDSGVIDCLQLTPSRLSQLLAAGSERIEVLSKLQVLLIGGEALSFDHYERLTELSTTRVIQVYGPTETTIWSSSSPVERGKRLTIGTPLYQERIYILRDNDLCPVGIEGEICISGSGVARGYLNREEQTGEKFVMDPFVAGARLYRTGDIGKWGSDGQIEFIGRKDAQVKIRGYRIELGEIENALLSYPSVSSAVVQGLPLNNEGLELVAYVVVSSTLDVSLLRTHLSMRLPSYMLPQHYVELTSMPLNSSGKIDRKHLPDPHGVSMTSSTTYMAPRNETEEKLVAIWCTILNKETIGVFDNFFEIGGDSLKAIKIITSVKAILSWEVTLKDLFSHPTVEQFITAKQETEIQQRSSLIEHAPAYSDEITSAPETFDESVLDLIRRGALPSLDGVAVSYLQDALPGEQQLSQEIVYNEIFNKTPQILIIHHTLWGNIGIALLPVFRSELYINHEKLLDQLEKAVILAKQVGAKTVTLTGLLPSATQYGVDLVEKISNLQDLPIVSTGHATTCAAVALNIEHILNRSCRMISRERICFLGCGSIGINTLRIVMKLGHPAAIVLCDVPSKELYLKSIELELKTVWEYKGSVEIVISRNGILPQNIYSNRFFVGATNAPDILDVEKLLPGTIIVDDSAPHCFDKDKAIARFESSHDILFTEGGRLKIPVSRSESVFLPPYLKKAGIGVNDVYRSSDPDSIMGCVFSSVLYGITPTIGTFDVNVSFENYLQLKSMDISGAELHCGNYKLNQGQVEEFSKLYGN